VSDKREKFLDLADRGIVGLFKLMRLKQEPPTVKDVEAFVDRIGGSLTPTEIYFGKMGVGTLIRQIK